MKTNKIEALETAQTILNNLSIGVAALGIAGGLVCACGLIQEFVNRVVDKMASDEDDSDDE